MTRLEALIALRDAVREGDFDETLLDYVFGRKTRQKFYAGEAFRGSLEGVGAAIALMHDRLPGWAVEGWTIWPGLPSRVKIVGTHEGEDGTRWHKFKDGWAQAEAHTPARALLLAILEALIAKEGA